MTASRVSRRDSTGGGVIGAAGWNAARVILGQG